MKYSSKLKTSFEDDAEWPETIKEFKMKKKKKKSIWWTVVLNKTED